MKALQPLFFMVRNPIPLIAHLICWTFASALLFFMLLAMTVSPEEKPDDIWELITLISAFGRLLPWIALIAFIISYREARGNLKGIAKEHYKWSGWYTQQHRSETFDEAYKEPPSKNIPINSYFRRVQKTLRSMIHNPMSFITHFMFWLAALILLYIMTHYLGIVAALRYSVQLLPEFAIPSAILASVSSYQEAKGIIKGAAKEREVWTKWYQRQTEAKAHGYTLDEPPPSLIAD